MVLELGIAIIAVCLPSIWMVLASKTPEAFLRSVHSLVSLDSRNSKRSQEHLPSETLQSNASTSSRISIAGPSSGESHELSNAKGANLEIVPERQIHVSRSVEQSFKAKKHEEV